MAIVPPIPDRVNVKQLVDYSDTTELWDGLGNRAGLAFLTLKGRPNRAPSTANQTSLQRLVAKQKARVQDS